MASENPAVERLNLGDPPSLVPGSTALLLDMINEDKEVAEIVASLEQFASIAGKLISLANSAWSAPVREITSLADACGRLGMDVVRSIAIGLAVGRPFDTATCPSFDRVRYWSTSFLGAEIAASLAPRFGYESATARAAALLYSIGLLWLADQEPEKTDCALANCEQEPSPKLSDELTSVFGLDHIEAGRQMLLAWDMPQILVNALSPPEPDAATSTQDEEFSSLIHNAATLASYVYQNPEDLDWSTCPLDPDEYAAAYEQSKKSLDRILAMAETLFSP